MQSLFEVEIGRMMLSGELLRVAAPEMVSELETAAVNFVCTALLKSYKCLFIR